MTGLQYGFAAGYGVICCILLALITMQQSQEKNALGALSGGAGDTYYAKHAGQSAEAKKKRWTKVFAVLFVAMNVAAMFVFVPAQ